MFAKEHYNLEGFLKRRRAELVAFFYFFKIGEKMNKGRT